MVYSPRITPPTPVQQPQSHAFPVVATIAPVAMSVVIWMITKSPFVLMFAALGPVVAVASVLDGRRQSRRRLRDERARFDRELSATIDEIAVLHYRERTELDLDAPSAAARLGRGDHDPERWASSIASAELTIGRGIRPSSLELDASTTRGSGALTELAESARTLDDAPLMVAAALGIAIVGPRVLARSVARGFVCQLAAVLPPGETEISVSEIPDQDHWLHALPHRLVADSALRGGEIAFRQGQAGNRVTVATGATVDDVPSHVRVVLRAGDGAEVLRHPDRSCCIPLALEYVSREQARSWAGRLGLLAGDVLERGLPAEVALASLLTEGSTGSLTAPIGVDADGPCTVDLVSDGPHAIVGGTTGSGKSELLIAWVLGLAHAYPPADVTFLLVDFKGGSSFAPLEHLPHCVGVMSDLDERSALRALESLTAEVRFRERALAAAGARSIEQLSGGLPRLVIVVDEFAAMVGEFPDLHALFADLAARGRSLGLHLVLCTQRPAGAVRDAVLANAGLRISLRVNNRADSQAVIGTDVATQLPARPRGRAFLSVAGEPPRELQIALAAPGDSSAVAARWPGSPSPRRPWRDPLPTLVLPEQLDRVEGVPFGVVDLPEQQAQPTVGWNPGVDGNVLVIGAARSGKSSAVAAFARGDRARIVSTDPERAWDAVFETLRDIRIGGAGGGVLALDDLDATLARFGDEHASAFLDALSGVLREGPARGIHTVLATQRITPSLHSIAALCDRRLLLRMTSKQEHVIAGGQGETFDSSTPPGRGTWDGHPLQVARVEHTDVAPPAELHALEPPFAVVSGSPRAFVERAVSRGVSVAPVGSDEPADIVIGDPEAWQSRWGLLQTVSATMPVLFDRCGLSDFRLLTRLRVLPPPIITSTDAGWVLMPDGDLRRMRY